MGYHLIKPMIHSSQGLTQGRGDLGRGSQVHLLEPWTQEAGIGRCDEERPATALRRQPIPVAAGEFMQHTFADQAAEVIAHLARSVGDRCPAQQVPDQGPQRAIRDPIGGAKENRGRESLLLSGVCIALASLARKRCT